MPKEAGAVSPARKTGMTVETDYKNEKFVKMHMELFEAIVSENTN